MKKKKYIFEEDLDDTDDTQSTSDEQEGEQEGEEDANKESEVVTLADSIDADPQTSEDNSKEGRGSVDKVINTFKHNLKQAFTELGNHRYINNTIDKFSNGIASLIEKIFNEINDSIPEDDIKGQVGNILAQSLPSFGGFCGQLIDSVVKEYMPSTEEDYSRVLSDIDKKKIGSAIEQDEKLREVLITAMKQVNAEKRGVWNKQLSDPYLFDAIIENFEKHLEAAIKDSLLANIEAFSNQPEPEPKQTSESILYSNFLSREVAKSCSSLFESVLEMHSPKQLFVNRLNESISKNKSLDKVIKSREYKKLNKMGVPNSVLSDYVEVYSDYLRSPSTKSLNETTKFGSEAIKKSIKSFFFESELDQRFIVKPTVAETIKDLREKDFRIEKDKDKNVYIATKDDTTIFIPFCRIKAIDDKDFIFYTQYLIQKDNGQEIEGKKYTFQLKEFVERTSASIVESLSGSNPDDPYVLDGDFKDFLKKDLIDFLKAANLGVKAENKINKNSIHKFIYENFSLFIYGGKKIIPKLSDLYYNKFSNNKIENKEKFTISKIISIVEVFFPIIFNTQTQNSQIKQLLEALSISKLPPGKLNDNTSDFRVVSELIENLQQDYVTRSNIEAYEFIYDNYNKFEKLAEILIKYEKSIQNFKNKNKTSSFWKRAKEISRELLNFEKSPVLQSINKLKEPREETEEEPTGEESTEEESTEEESEEEEKQKKDKKTNILRRIKRKISRDPRIKMPKENLDKVAKAVALRTASTVDAIVDIFVNKSIESDLSRNISEGLVNNFSKKLTDSIVVAINNMNNSSSILNEDRGINKLVNKIYTSDEVQNVIDQFNKDLIKYKELLILKHPVTQRGTNIDPSKNYLRKSAQRRLSNKETGSSKPATTPTNSETIRVEPSDEQASETEETPATESGPNSSDYGVLDLSSFDDVIDRSFLDDDASESNSSDDDASEPEPEPESSETVAIPASSQPNTNRTKVNTTQAPKGEVSRTGETQRSNNNDSGENNKKRKDLIIERIEIIKEGDRDLYSRKQKKYKRYQKKDIESQKNYIERFAENVLKEYMDIKTAIEHIITDYPVVSAKLKKDNSFKLNLDYLPEKLIEIILDQQEKDNETILECYFFFRLLLDLDKKIKSKPEKSNTQDPKDEKVSGTGEEQNSNNEVENDKKEGGESPTIEDLGTRIRINERILERINKIKEKDENLYSEKQKEYESRQGNYIKILAKAILENYTTIEGGIGYIIEDLYPAVAPELEKAGDSFKIDLKYLLNELTKLILNPQEEDSGLILECYFLYKLLLDLNKELKSKSEKS